MEKELQTKITEILQNHDVCGFINIGAPSIEYQPEARIITKAIFCYNGNSYLEEVIYLTFLHLLHWEVSKQTQQHIKSDIDHFIKINPHIEKEIAKNPLSIKSAQAIIDKIFEDDFIDLASKLIDEYEELLKELHY